MRRAGVEVEVWLPFDCWSVVLGSGFCGEVEEELELADELEEAEEVEGEEEEEDKLCTGAWDCGEEDKGGDGATGTGGAM
jgi:hypothetical protein